MSQKDGRLRPVRGLQWLWRTQFETEHEGVRYAVDADLLDIGEKLVLFRDGVRVAEQSSPARFTLGPEPRARAGKDDYPRIEAAMSWYGLKRAHLVLPTHDEQLTPARGTAEAWRADLHRNHRGASTVLAVVSLTILLLAALLELPQLAEWIAHSGWWAQVSDWRFDSPVSLPPWANTALTVGGVVAGVERALRLKHNAWLD